jgi:predicted alpha/beta superfamily hydrolase
MRGFLISVLFFSAAIAVPPLVATAASPKDDSAVVDPAQSGGQPVTISGARQYDFTSKLNGQTYRVMVFTSPKADAQTSQPVVNVLDGNYYFATACDAMGINLLTGTIVGIGYPTDDRDEIVQRRGFDLTIPSASSASTSEKKHGGGDAFLRVVQEEIKPFVAAHYKIDPARQALFGHSLGGLMVLRELFRHPEDYATYIAASPSIWWGEKAVLADEAAFSKRVQEGAVHVRLLLTSAANEQKGSKNGMVTNATELASRLTPLNPQNFPVTRAIFPDENHRSGSQAALVRALCFTLQAKE